MNTRINENIFDKFPVLESDRLIFRSYMESDAAVQFQLRSNEAVMKFMDNDAHQSEAESLSMINWINESYKAKGGINWVIVEKESKQMIGYFGFWRLMKIHVRAEIGYALLPEFWGKGYMTEAANALLKFGFNEMGLHSVEGNVNKLNADSIKLLEKLGFVKEAHFRENYFFNGKFIDSIIYSLLENDFIKPQ